MRNILTTTALLASASLALLTGSSHATPVTATDGELILGFRATGGTGSSVNLEVDLGSIALIGANIVYTAPGGSGVTLTPGSTMTLTGLNVSDLNSNFGTSLTWNKRSDLLWSVVGTTFNSGNLGLATNTLWGTSVNNAVVPKQLASSFQSAAAGNIDTYTASFGSGTQGANTTAVTKTNSVGGSYTVQEGGNAFGFHTNSQVTEQVLENNTNIVDNSFVSSELYQLTSQSGTHPASDLGTMKLSSAGVLTFTAVPEPSTYVMFAVGVAALFVLRRRRSAKA